MSSSKLNVVISREGGDFSMDLIWAGLVRALGPEAVADYPVRRKHREGPPVLVGDHERDYGAERRSLCYTGVTDFREWTRQELMLAAMKGDVGLVFLDETDDSFLRYLELFGAVPYGFRPRTVVVAGHDSFRGDPRQVIDRFGPALAAMFIDDWRPEYDDLPKTHLINLSSNFDHLWDVSRRDELLADKCHDICFVGYGSNPVRRQVIDHIRSRWGHLDNHIIFEERPDEFSGFVRHREYFRSIAQSRICVNLPGASTGGRALRFYEVPYVGSYMLSMRFAARLLHPFEDGVHCGYFTTAAELDRQVGLALEDPDGTELIAANGREHALRHHTVDARIRYVLDKVVVG